MMAVGNKKMSETQATFYPPTLIPSFIDSYPPTKLDLSLYDSGSIGYFQNYRNETLSKFSVKSSSIQLIKTYNIE